MLVHYSFGIPATVLAGLAAALGGPKLISTGLAALLAGVAAGLTALMTWLKASAKWDSAKRFEYLHQTIAEEAGLTLTSGIAYDDLEILKTKLDDLQIRRNKVTTESMAPS